MCLQLHLIRILLKLATHKTFMNVWIVSIEILPLCMLFIFMPLMKLKKSC